MDKAFHGLSASSLPHNSTSSAFAQTIPQLPPAYKAHMLKCSIKDIELDIDTIIDISYDLAIMFGEREMLGKQLIHHKKEKVFFCVCVCVLPCQL